MGGVVRDANQAAFNRRPLLRLALPGAGEKLLARATAGRTLGVFAIHDQSDVEVEGLCPSDACPGGPLSAGDLKAGIVRWLEEAA